jgi:hypothetical protein
MAMAKDDLEGGQIELGFVLREPYGGHRYLSLDLWNVLRTLQSKLFGRAEKAVWLLKVKQVRYQMPQKLQVSREAKLGKKTCW